MSHAESMWRDFLTLDMQVGGEAILVRRRFSLILFIFFNIGTPFALAQVGDMRGMIIPPDPSGCKDVGGMLLTLLGDEAKGRPRYLTTTLKCSDKYFILLKRKIAGDGRGSTWKVVDQAILSNLKHGHEIFPPIICESKDFPRNPTMAVGKFVKQRDNSFESRDVTHAWRFDLDKERIEPIPLAGARCSIDAVH